MDLEPERLFSIFDFHRNYWFLKLCEFRTVEKQKEAFYAESINRRGNDKKYQKYNVFIACLEKHQKNSFLARTQGTIVWKKMLNVQILC